MIDYQRHVTRVNELATVTLHLHMDSPWQNKTEICRPTVCPFSPWRRSEPSQEPTCITQVAQDDRDARPIVLKAIASIRVTPVFPRTAFALFR
jgi:hypothetical protein